ncbi:hypothetical protein MVEN_00078700 [Mycena venus]|uniref:Uncharacterized protein n=1 Tax=Mycena venus TaxID=2733690 RepID=A0A8H6Z737_9AGAR|nr:hypothetical protein MVEN_00078700 [Mycena venus]
MIFRSMSHHYIQCPCLRRQPKGFLGLSRSSHAELSTMHTDGVIEQLWSIIRAPVPKCNAVRIFSSRRSSFCNTADSDLLVREHHPRCLVQIPTVSRHLTIGRILAVSAQSNLFASDFPPARKLRRQRRISAIYPNESPRNVHCGCNFGADKME